MARDTAATTAVPRLVDHKELEAANGRLQSGSLDGGELAGPAVGGWLFGIDAALPLAMNASGIARAAPLLLTLPSVFTPLPVRAAGSAGSGATSWQDCDGCATTGLCGR